MRCSLPVWRSCPRRLASSGNRKLTSRLCWRLTGARRPMCSQRWGILCAWCCYVRFSVEPRPWANSARWKPWGRAGRSTTICASWSGWFDNARRLQETVAKLEIASLHAIEQSEAITTRSADPSTPGAFRRRPPRQQPDIEPPPAGSAPPQTPTAVTQLAQTAESPRSQPRRMLTPTAPHPFDMGQAW